MALVGTRSAQAAEALVELDFGNIHEHPVGPRGLRLSEAVRHANCRRVRLVGYVVAQDQPMPDRFYFSPTPLAMSEHADGEADDLPPSTVVVLLPAAGAPRPAPGRRTEITGTLQIGRLEHADGRVSWLRLQLQPATAEASQPGLTR